MNGSRVTLVVFLGAATLLALVSFAGSVLYLAGFIPVDVGGRGMELGVAVVLLIGGAALSAGAWGSARSQSGNGGALLAAGALPVAACFWWTGIVPAIAIPVAVAGVVKRRRKVAQV